jgi:hypothetical protein
LEVEVFLCLSTPSGLRLKFVVVESDLAIETFAAILAGKKCHVLSRASSGAGSGRIIPSKDSIRLFDVLIS